MPRLSFAFLGVATAAALGLTLLQAQITAAGPGATGLPDQPQVHTYGHGVEHQAN
ncbi:hypothetical protein [Tropicimonas sp. IMCC6043]|uniref:hypothetical protein n=1 Tax=Tropicimonas sp. IMCC6043 TaxID=2510645 RepID=UPI0013ECDAB3|nr:hypothetical protein [Tropicimonas sp. IMCC6043]